MIDIAQLREALHGFDVGWGHWPSVKLVLDLANERLAQMEAGALIITPDENGWPVWAQALVMNVSENTIRMGREIPRDACRRLDALRDAMPGTE